MTTTRTRVVRSDVAAGEKEPAVTRAGGAIFGWLLRQVGVATGRDYVGLGTHELAFANDSTRRMHCDVRWVVMETTAAKRDGGDATTERIAERIDCEAMLDRAPGVHWHFSRGEPLAHDSAAPAPAAKPAGSPPTPLYALPMRLSREDSTNRVEATYNIALDPVVTELMQVQMTVWRIRRADGTLVATLYWRYWRDASVLELSDAATPDEEAVLRLATVAVLLPFESTR